MPKFDRRVRNPDLDNRRHEGYTFDGGSALVSYTNLHKATAISFTSVISRLTRFLTGLARPYLRRHY